MRGSVGFVNSVMNVSGVRSGSWLMPGAVGGGLVLRQVYNLALYRFGVGYCVDITFCTLSAFGDCMAMELIKYTDIQCGLYAIHGCKDCDSYGYIYISQMSAMIFAFHAYS
jgi:hypothetical protein